MVTPAEIGVTGVLAGWLLLSVYKNLPGAARRVTVLNRLTSTWLVPSWAFFAPVPGTKCYHVFVRDYGMEGFRSWRLVPQSGRRRRLRAMWSPEKTHNKAMVDIANDVAALLMAFTDAERRTPPASLQATMPYLVLLAFVSGLPRLDDAIATQFAIAQSDPEGGDVLLVSALHRL